MYTRAHNYACILEEHHVSNASLSMNVSVNQKWVFFRVFLFLTNKGFVPHSLAFCESSAKSARADIFLYLTFIYIYGPIEVNNLRPSFLFSVPVRCSIVRLGQELMMEYHGILYEIWYYYLWHCYCGYGLWYCWRYTVANEYIMFSSSLHIW